MTIKYIYHLLPMWFWKVIILISMIGMYLIMCFIELIILDLVGGNKDERTDDSSS